MEVQATEKQRATSRISIWAAALETCCTRKDLRHKGSLKSQEGKEHVDVALKDTVWGAVLVVGRLLDQIFLEVFSNLTDFMVLSQTIPVGDDVMLSAEPMLCLKENCKTNKK